MPIFFKNNKGLDSGSNNTKVIQSNDITSAGVFKSKVNIDGMILNYDAADFDSFPPQTSTTNIISNAIHMNGWGDYGYGNDGKFTTEFNTTGYRMINRGSWNGIYQGFSLPSTGYYTFSAWYRWWSSGSGNNGATSYQSGFGVGSVLLILALIVFIFFVGRAMGRRSNPVVYPANNGGNYGQQPYGSGMPMGGPMGGGMGSGILGGLATGAALGAGMVAGEELMHHFTDGDRTSGGIVSNANAGDSWSDANDLGGSYFGVTDSGSWDDGGGGDWT